jgi:putative transferase (TIGR04331 family)
VEINYFWEKEAVSKGLKIISDCRPALLCALENLLNRYLETNRSKKYYDILAGMWLEQFMHVSYVAWEQVRTLPPFTDEKPILELTATPTEFSNLVVNSCDYRNNLRLAIQRILADEKPIAWLQKTEDTITNGNFLQNCTMISLRGAKELFKRFIFREIFSKNAEVLICKPYFKCNPKDWMLALWKWRHWIRRDDLDEFITVPVRYDHAWRYRRSKECGTTGDFSDALKCLLPLCIPAVFLEGYKDFHAQVLALNKSKPRIVYTANALHFNLTFKFVAAAWQEQGTIILCHQHGGGYGLDQIHAVEDYETRVSDQFYSWGWQREDFQVHPLSVGIHCKKRLKNSKQILLSCGEYPINVYRLHFQPMPGTIETMIRDTVDFVSKYPEQANLLIRPNIPDYGWGFLDKLKQVAPIAKYDTGKRRPSPFKRYAQSRLVVHNYLGTSWLETLALNIPTVCFFDPNTYEFRQAAKPYIEDLEQVGILHQSGKEAARFVRDKWPVIETWWQQPEVQKARSAFCANYANFSPDWPQQWEVEFKRVLSQSVDKPK